LPSAGETNLSELLTTTLNQIKTSSTKNATIFQTQHSTIKNSSYSVNTSAVASFSISGGEGATVIVSNSKGFGDATFSGTDGTFSSTDFTGHHITNDVHQNNANDVPMANIQHYTKSFSDGNATTIDGNNVVTDFVTSSEVWNEDESNLVGMIQLTDDIVQR
jgi:hypothetical protein